MPPPCPARSTAGRAPSRRRGRGDAAACAFAATATTPVYPDVPVLVLPPPVVRRGGTDGGDAAIAPSRAQRCRQRARRQLALELPRRLRAVTAESHADPRKCRWPAVSEGREVAPHRPTWAVGYRYRLLPFPGARRPCPRGVISSRSAPAVGCHQNNGLIFRERNIIFKKTMTLIFKEDSYLNVLRYNPANCSSIISLEASFFKHFC